MIQVNKSHHKPVFIRLWRGLLNSDFLVHQWLGYIRLVKFVVTTARLKSLANIALE